jgi:hypothetical protein
MLRKLLETGPRYFAESTLEPAGRNPARGSVAVYPKLTIPHVDYAETFFQKWARIF